MKKIVAILLILVLSINILLTVSSYTSIFGYNSIKVVSGSMIPSIKLNSVIVIKKSNYKVGDIITFKKDNVLITHRIKEIDGNNVTTMGDSNNTADSSIKLNQIKGKVVFVIDNIYIIRISLLILCVIYCLIERKDTNEE